MLVEIKSILKNFYWLPVAVLMLALLPACKKENVGAPVITGLRAISPAPNDTTLTQVTPGQIVVIKGSNFDDLQQVLFDGYPASVNTALNTSASIVITVPTGILFAQLSPETANTIKVVTSHGETSYKFSVSPPPPAIVSISNEFARAGDMITISGSYLYTVQAVVFPGNISVNNGFTSDANGNTLQVQVPSGVTAGDADSISVVTEGGVGKAPFNNTYGMIANFESGDSKFGWQWWGANLSSDDTKFPGAWGSFIEMNPSSDVNGGDNSWWANNRAVMIAQSDWEGVNIADPTTNYALKFQLYVKNPWTAGSLETVINGNFDYMASYSPWAQASNKSFVTNGWITVTLPLNNFVNGSGSPANNVSALTGSAKGATVQIMLYNNGTTPVSNFDAAVDNVRIVKIK